MINGLETVKMNNVIGLSNVVIECDMSLKNIGYLKLLELYSSKLY